MKFVVTGATGYIGQHLIYAAQLVGHEILALSRNPLEQESLTWQFFDLNGDGKAARRIVKVITKSNF